MAPTELPDLEKLKAEAEKLKSGSKRKASSEAGEGEGAKGNKKQKGGTVEPSKRLFVGNLPYIISATQIEAALGAKLKHVQWLTNKQSGLFYGSVFVSLKTLDEAREVVAKANQGGKDGKNGKGKDQVRRERIASFKK